MEHRRRGLYEGNMQKTGLRRGAASAGTDSLFPSVGGMAASVGSRLGKRVPWGGQHDAGVYGIADVYGMQGLQESK